MQKVYDAIIIGSGASGGMAAKQLTEHGFEVLVLEAGPPVNPSRDMNSHKNPWESMYRGFGKPGWCDYDQWMQDMAGAFLRHFYVKVTDDVHCTDPGKPAMWVRGRRGGSKSIPWGAL